MHSSESPEHKRIKELISTRLQEWTGKSIPEYPSSGRKFDVFAVTLDGIGIHVEIIWSATSRNFDRGMKIILQSNAKVKLVVVSPKILDNEEYRREFDKIVISEREKGVRMHGELINGKRIIEDTEFLETEFKEIVLGLIENSTRDEASIPPKEKHPEIPHYLSRKVCPAKEYSAISTFLLGNELSQDVVSVIEQCNRIVLLSDAGVGKTTELRRIARHFSEDETPLYPFLVHLNKYVGQRLSELLPSYWTKIPEGQLLIILDGLDEIESKNKNDAIRQIELFSEQHSKSKIIISCRTNFYKTETKKSSGTLAGFSSHVLLNLDSMEIERYIKTRLRKRECPIFKRAIYDNQLQGLLGIPFYLERLIELYEANHTLPKSKAEIFEHLLIARIELDAEHFRTTIELHEKQEIIIETLERLALGMEVLGRNYITDDEFRKLVPNESLRTLTKYCTVWTKSEGDTITWQFEHNNFQEYLAARVLSRQSLQTVKDFASFKPDYQKLIPSWTNTLSLILSISDDPDLFHWILDNEPELVVKFEPDKIENATRIRIFKEIFNDYKAKQIWINRDKFRYKELARFGQSKEIIDFLLREAETATHYTTICNAIEILGYMEIPTSLRLHTRRVLVRHALSDDEGEIVQNHALVALTNLRLNSQRVVNQLVPKLQLSDSDEVRYGLYYLLHNSDCLDENIETFLDGIKHVRFDSSNISGKVRLAGEHWQLCMGLEKAKSPNAIMRIFTYFKDHPEDLDDAFLERSIPIIAENAANAYLKEPSLFELAIELLTVLVGGHLDKETRQFMRFFDKSETRLQAFKKVFAQRNSKKDRLIILATLADMKCIKFFVQQHEKLNMTDHDVWAFQNYLGWKNQELYLPFNELINQESGNKFVLPPRRDIAKERKLHRRRDIDLLFDKQAFIDELKLIFDTEKKQTFTSKELLDVEFRPWDERYFSDLAIRTLHRIARNQAVSLKTVTQIVDGWNWDQFCINKTREYLKDDEEMAISRAQKDWIATWCYSNLNKVNFRTALLTKPNRETSADWRAICLWFFLRSLNLTYQRDVLLDMLSFDWIEKNQMLGIEYLEERIDETEITARILENLQEGIQNDDVLKNHIDYCKRKHIEEVLPFALREINNTDRNSNVRSVALETICELSETFSDLEQILPKITDDFKWNVVKELLNRDSKYCHDFLLGKLTNGNEQEKLKAAEYLIELQDIKGLKHYVTWVKRYRKLPETWLYESPLRSLRVLESMPFLIQLLEISYQDDFVQGDFQRLDSVVLDVLSRIALQSDQHYDKIKEVVERFIKRRSSVINDVNFLYIFLERLEQSYYMAKSEKPTINDVLEKLKKIYPRPQ